MSAPEQLFPSRVVDAEQYGWMATAETLGGPIVYTRHHDVYLPFDELRAHRGPLRPVEPITADDRQALRDALALAGRKAVYSLAFATYRTWAEVRADHGGMERPMESHEVSHRQMIAGRPGSWEASSLIDLALWVGHGKPSRIHADAGAAMQAILYRWVTDPDRYTEVAETLAAVVSRYADEHGGWRAIADQWLQPGALDQEGVRVTYSLLYSLSEHFDPAVLG